MVDMVYHVLECVLKPSKQPNRDSGQRRGHRSFEQAPIYGLRVFLRYHAGGNSTMQIPVLPANLLFCLAPGFYYSAT